MEKILFLALFFCSVSNSEIFAQCEIRNRLQADGSMLYYFEPEIFYTTKSKSLKINVVTDKEHYFVALQPTPFPEKNVGKKIKDDLVIILSNNQKYTLSHYDTQYQQNDSVMQVLYLIDEKDLKSFSTFDAIAAEINIQGTEFMRRYNFKLHKSAMTRQLNCFLSEKDK
ncbi:hypothetical protein [Flavobacterium olei]|uniref:hypothetical protein n=1 Tax=Flavobacterium olei TaxID=1886782 RepID=UPI00321AB04C